MRHLYIDPGTGSMLFAILIGLISAATYMLRSWWVKVRFRLTGGKKSGNTEKLLPIVIFSDDKRYWPVFEPICRELDKRGADVTYMTASPDDPALNNEYEHIKGEFIGEGNRAFARMNLLNAVVVLSTTPGLDVYQWKRSKGVKYYVHMLHAPVEVAGYRMFGVDYYDSLLLSGDYQVRDTRYLEKIRNLPEKEIEMIGIPYMDEMAKRLASAEPLEKNGTTTVLLAPTWGNSSIFSKYGSRIIDKLLETGYHVIIRPHPQSFVSEKEMMDELMEKYPESAQLEWNRDNDNFNVLRRADIMISDFSGVIFDFSLVYDKPVIYADTEYDNSPYDAWWLDTEYWTFTALPRIGQKLSEDNLDNIKNVIDTCLTAEEYDEGRREVRAETWVYPGEGAVRAADYLVRKYNELTSNEESADELTEGTAEQKGESEE